MDKLMGCLAPGEEINLGNSMFIITSEGMKEFQFSDVCDPASWKPIHEIEKPLFIPLKGEHYDAFERGDKTTEYRAYGPRWNEKTCHPYRWATLSRGYGKKNRMMGVIGKSEIAPPTKAFLEIYGAEKQCFAISFMGLWRING